MFHKLLNLPIEQGTSEFFLTFEPVECERGCTFNNTGQIQVLVPQGTIVGVHIDPGTRNLLRGDGSE